MKTTTCVACITLLILLTGCAPQSQEVKIGGLFSLTGYASPAGRAARDGFLMALEDSGLNASAVNHDIKDFQSDPIMLAIAANQLADDHATVIIGPEWNEYGAVVSPIAKDRKILFISPWMTGEDAWVKGSQYYMSATASDRGGIRKILTYLATHNASSMVVVYSDNSFSAGNVAILKDELQYTTINITDEFEVAQDATNFSGILNIIKKDPPDAIYTVISTDESQGAFSRQLYDASILSQVFVPFSRATITFLTNKYSNGTIYPAIKEYKNMAAFQAKYRARFGKNPEAISAATAYDMTTLALQAVKEGARTPNDVKDYFTSIEGYEGYANRYTYNPNHHLATDEIVLRQIGEKEITTIG